MLFHSLLHLISQNNIATTKGDPIRPQMEFLSYFLYVVFAMGNISFPRQQFIIRMSFSLSRSESFVSKINYCKIETAVEKANSRRIPHILFISVSDLTKMHSKNILEYKLFLLSSFVFIEILFNSVVKLKYGK